MVEEFLVPPVINWVATFLWAASGGIVAIRKRFDVVGVFVLALLSAMGGGIIRDGLFLHRTPVAVQDPYYLLVIVFATLVVVALGRFLLQFKYWGELVGLIDAIATPGYAIVGMQLALGAGISLPGAIFIGAINGVGGGVLRDLMVGDVPSILQPGQLYGLIVGFCCVQFIFLTLQLKIDPAIAGWTTIATFFFIRVLAIHFNWRTSPVGDSQSANTQ
jgi:uncharacterized membrane protein YeiH